MSTTKNSEIADVEKLDVTAISNQQEQEIEDDEFYPVDTSQVISLGGEVRNQDYIETKASELSGVDKETVKLVFNTCWDTICRELELGNTVKLHGKGRFYLSKRSERVGRNPLTGEKHLVPKREAMAFQTSPAYAKRLRERREEIKRLQEQLKAQAVSTDES